MDNMSIRMHFAQISIPSNASLLYHLLYLPRNGYYYKSNRRHQTYAHRLRSTAFALIGIPSATLLMLGGHGLASSLLDQLFGNITKSNHAHGLPYAETDTRSYSTVQAFDTTRAVDVAESVADGHLLRAVRVFLLRLHLHSYDFNRLIPGTETSTDC